MNLDLESIINSVGRRGTRTRAEYTTAPAQRLKQWWVAERMAPHLLEYQLDLLNEVITNCRSLRDYIEETSLTLLDEAAVESLGEETLRDVKIKLLLVETELERAKFVARAYKRTRMAKIDLLPYYYLQQQESQSGIMSKDEWVYCHHRTELEASSYYKGFLNAFPTELQGLTDEDGHVSMIETPDMDKPVVVRVNTDIGTLKIGSEEVELVKNGVYLLRFSAVSDYLEFVDIL